jgi:hypothetical protein
MLRSMRAGPRMSFALCGWVAAIAACGGATRDGATRDRAIRQGSEGTAHHADTLAHTDTREDDTWLAVSGNHIVTVDGKPLHARGANLHDPRSCDGCTYLPLDVAETERRADELIVGWKATLVRFDLESYTTAAYPKGNQRVDGQWKNILDDPAYFAAIQKIVRHMTELGAYVLVSEWLDPTTTENELPTERTNREWELLARAFADDPRVMYGLVNEPHDAPEKNADAFSALNATVQTIRDVENALGAKHHIVSVPGVDGYARNVAYFVDHPITAGGGANVVYEVHVYNGAADFEHLFVAPSAKIPIVIGEFGPSANPPMTTTDITTMMDTAEKIGIPYVAWNFHSNCPPNLLQSASGAGGCGVGMPLTPTPEWGALIKQRLATPW